MSNDPLHVTINLDEETALVLFEWLYSISIENSSQPATSSALLQLNIGFTHPGQYVALMRLLGALEETLVAPFHPDYNLEVRSALERLWRSFSGNDDD